MPLDRKDPEVIALIEEVTAAATEALSAKNRELLGEVKTLKVKAKGAEIDPAEHAALQQQIEDLTAKLDKAVKDGAKTVEKLTQDLATKDGALSQHLIDGGLTDALAKSGVAPQFMDAAKALLKGAATIKDGAAVIGDKALGDHVKEWAASDQGKHFVAAPANGGGGAPGGNGNNNPPAGNMGGTREERKAALAAKYPELQK
ncbi:hypothetical protein AB4Z48_18100 [Cupriavidus sp. 2TAF22]|uniref:hypothetical protein n=1 Tax=unclassified Cupriavidus TaxID=2640874 RepID=UPI003F930F1B